MTRILQLSLLLLLITLFSGCSNVKSLVASNGVTNNKTSNPLKSKDDLIIEKLITHGTWVYQRQNEDCDDTTWKQRFHKSRYYQSAGSACLVPDSFSVDAESWYIKDQNLYITNLSPKEKDDIILKYGIEYIDKAKLELSSNGYKYIFLNQ